MYVFSRVLGDVVRAAREDKNLSQAELAEKLDLDVRTIVNIENYRGNPKMQVLFPLIRELSIQPDRIFYPELEDKREMEEKLLLEIYDCDEREMTAIFTLIRSFREAVRSVRESTAL